MSRELRLSANGVILPPDLFTPGVDDIDIIYAKKDIDIKQDLSTAPTSHFIEDAGQDTMHRVTFYGTKRTKRPQSLSRSTSPSTVQDAEDLRSDEAIGPARGNCGCRPVALK
jgi:hypothetical protein